MFINLSVGRWRLRGASVWGACRRRARWWGHGHRGGLVLQCFFTGELLTLGLCQYPRVCFRRCTDTTCWPCASLLLFVSAPNESHRRSTPSIEAALPAQPLSTLRVSSALIDNHNRHVGNAASQPLCGHLPHVGHCFLARMVDSRSHRAGDERTIDLGHDAALHCV